MFSSIPVADNIDCAPSAAVLVLALGPGARGNSVPTKQPLLLSCILEDVTYPYHYYDGKKTGRLSSFSLTPLASTGSAPPFAHRLLVDLIVIHHSALLRYSFVAPIIIMLLLEYTSCTAVDNIQHPPRVYQSTPSSEPMPSSTFAAHRETRIISECCRLSLPTASFRSVFDLYQIFPGGPM